MRKHPQQMSMIHASLGWVTWTSPSSHPTIVFPVRAPSQFLFRSIDLSARWPARFVIFVRLMIPFATNTKKLISFIKTIGSVKGMHFESRACGVEINSGESRLRGENPVREWIINENWLLNYSGVREFEENSGWIAVGSRKCGSDVGLLSSRAVYAAGARIELFLAYRKHLCGINERK